MTTQNNYMLNRLVFGKLSKRRGRVICYRCGGPLKVGDQVVSRLCHRKVKLYHEACWESLFR